MVSLSNDKQADISEAFNTTCRYLDDILNINNIDILTISYEKYTLQSFNLTNQIPLVLKPCFWTCICSF